MVIVAQAAGAQPTGNRAAANGEQQAAHDRQQPPGDAAIEHSSEALDPTGQVGSEAWGSHPWLSGATLGCEVPAIVLAEPLFCLGQFAPAVAAAKTKPFPE